MMDALLVDVFQAYYDARRNKRNTPSQLRFELDLERNLVGLCHDLRSRRYKPRPSVCFVVCDSVKREVFASDFRDRVVHHLYCNYVSALFDRHFIYDSYSCREGKGTLTGIERMEHHIRSATRNYTREAYVLQMDIEGYFMSIDRRRLCRMVHEMVGRIPLPPERRELVEWLTDVITLKDPQEGAVVKGDPREWDDLPRSKCLRFSPEGVGLPIGDLTSQLFSNVYLNGMDWHITRELGFKHYGRYVDDFYIVDCDRERLWEAVRQVGDYLSTLGLRLHPRKTRLTPATEPVRFLGAVVYPRYRHCAARTTRKWRSVGRVYTALCGGGTTAEELLPRGTVDEGLCLATMRSYCGYLGHFCAAGMLAEVAEG